VDGKTDFLRLIEADIDRRLAGEDTGLLKEFTRRFWARVPQEDLVARESEDAAGITLACWHLLLRRPPDASGVVVLNPDYERDGWETSHSVVQIVHSDMAFITDSVLMALTHHGLQTHHLQNVIFATERDAKGRLTAFSDASDANREVLIYAEVDRLDERQLKDLRERLTEILADVRSVVADFQSMRDRVMSLAEEARGMERDEAGESAAFLEWLLDNNFTFLGYREFEIGRQIKQIKGSELGVMRGRRSASTREISSLSQAAREFLLEPTVLAFSKSGTRSQVHRPAYPDYIAVKRFDDDGNVVGERGILGLYTSPVYTERPSRIPVLRQKVQRILERSQLDPAGFDGKVLMHVLATYPRDELFQSREDELLETVMDITHIHERRKIRLFVREDRYGLFYVCLVYMPREIYTTSLRIAVQEMLCRAFDAIDVEFNSYFSESILVRTQFIIRVDPDKRPQFDRGELEERIIDLTRDWSQEFHGALVQHFGEERGHHLARVYLQAFPVSYREAFGVRIAVYDVGHLEELSDEDDLAIRFYRPPEVEPSQVHLKVFHKGEALELSSILPTLENLGFHVVGEHPYRIVCGRGNVLSIQDFELYYEAPLDLVEIGDRFEDAFVRTWYGRLENDSFNRLVLAAGLDWKEVSLLRAYAHYMKQIRFGFSQQFMADTLVKHHRIARELVARFKHRFDPAEEESAGDGLQQALEAVELLNEDRILRRYVELIDATLRTNYFQTEGGEAKSYVSLKLSTRDVSELPEPRPAYEIFVYSAHMEGVHLRNGKIARGGLRWSDRHEDFRTEVLGLLKAQVVKNSVIVPTGAKGGFVVNQPQEGLSPADIQRQGLECYRLFIRGLLDVTDNIVGGEIVKPADVRCWDDDDPYLVVAADKGTARFSDTANEIAEAYGFWLGDAFASGGSRGYDHKGMGITARGAWISVQRHFRERGIDVQRDAVSVLGIGDMSGDVFGNGMLLSSSIELVAAFNHLHVFIDPNPDPLASFKERQRLFALEQSSWQDYDQTLISKGGGVFSRSQKRVPISPEMRERFDIAAEALAPDELVKALLKSPVDLIWNGGIGTYVKASNESHAEVGDRANDQVRVDASELRCKVFGEGGNLGLTQLGRIEFNRKEGAVNTDFIDNSAGVDTSDHEVNIKILLNREVDAGELTMKQRNKILEEMTEPVAALVLKNNFRQAQSLSIAERHCRTRLQEYQRFIGRMESERGLGRALEGIPTDDEITERAQLGQGLTRPELAVLLCYAKTHLKESLLTTEFRDDGRLAAEVALEFPEAIARRFGPGLSAHPLAGEIICTQVANDLVHHMGITFINHLNEFVGGMPLEVVRAYYAQAEIFDLRAQWAAIEALDVPQELCLEMQLELVRLGRRATRWFLRHCRGDLDVQSLVDRFAAPVATLNREPDMLMGRLARERWSRAVDDYVEAGVPRPLAERATRAYSAAAALPVARATEDAAEKRDLSARIFVAVGLPLGLDWLSEQISGMGRQNLWQAMERDALLDDLTTQQASICARIVRQTASVEEDASACVDAWLEDNRTFAAAWRRVIEEAQRSTTQEFALYSMTSRKLADLNRMLQ
jgi:glutamate dehydrogenase